MATIDELRTRGANLRKRISDLAAKWVDDPSALAEREKLRAELDILPGAIGELRRREVLAHIGKMAKEAADLAREVDAAETEWAALVAENRAANHDLVFAPDAAARLEVRKRLYASNKPLDAAQNALTLKRTKLEALYALAVRSYGVFLDGSERQLKHRENLPRTLSYAGAYTEKAWEEAAARLGRQAEEEARRELIGGVTTPKVWA